MKIISLTVISLAFTILLIALASAEFWACFSKAEKIDFCNPKTPDRTCGNQQCMYCMDSYDEVNNCYQQGNFNVCNNVEQECSTGSNLSDPILDIEPPVLTVNKPVEDEIYNSRSLLTEIFMDEKGDLSYYDNLDGGGRWTRLCQNCMSYNRKRSFKEGLNDITIRGMDVVGNEMFYNLSFYIDGHSPRLLRYNPRRGFASGMFDVLFKEQNPETLVLHFGNVGSGMNMQGISLLEDCTLTKDKYFCKVEQDLSLYDGEQISYWFELTDIAGNIVSHKPIMLDVDTTAPVITDIHYTQDGTRIELSITITEQNLQSVEYYDVSDPRTRWKQLCTRLKDGVCIKRITLRVGEHLLTIRALDKAGNTVEEELNIII